jgi:hypothetical protein
MEVEVIVIGANSIITMAIQIAVMLGYNGTDEEKVQRVTLELFNSRQSVVTIVLISRENGRAQGV